MKRVLILSPVGNLTSGATRGILATLIHLKSSGYEPVLIVPHKGDLVVEARKAGAKVKVISFDWWARPKYESRDNYSDSFIANGQSLEAILLLIKKYKPIACLSCTVVSPWLAYAASMSATPHAWQIYEHVEEPSPTFKFRLALNDLLDTVDALSDIVFAVSESVRKALSVGVAQSKLQIMYPYVPPLSERRAPALPKNIFSQNSFKAVMLGNIEENKGQLDAVKAVQTLRSQGLDIELLLVGGEKSAGYVKQIKNIIKENSLQGSIKLAGFVDNPQEYVKAAHISLICSERDAFPLVAIESMQLGTPVIASRSGGTQEIIHKDGQYGFLYDYGKVEDLASKIKQLAGDRQELQRVGQRAAQRVRDEYSSIENVHRPLTNYLKGVSTQSYSRQSLNLNPLSDIFELTKSLEHKLKLTNDYVKYMESKMAETDKKYSAIVSSKRWQAASKLATPKRFLKR